MSDVYDKLDNTTQPDLQAAKLGTLIEGAQVVVKVVIDADYTGEKSVTIPYDMEVIDVIVQCTAANGSGTLTLENGGHPVTDAMICAIDTTIVRAGTIDDAYSTLYTTSTVTVDAHGANDRGIMWIIGYRL